MTSLKQIQTQKQASEEIIQKAEKKIKNMKKLESILIGTGVLGIGSVIAALGFDNETLSSYLAGSGLLVGGASAIAGSSISEYRKALQDYLKIYKENYESKIKLENEHKAGLEDNQRLIIK